VSNDRLRGHGQRAGVPQEDGLRRPQPNSCVRRFKRWPEHFDKNGNQQVVRNPDGTRVTTTWNYENQPTQYNQPANATYPVVTMAYNAANQRIQQKA
jgi:hypothetical protein